jgi:hypothetical protein
LADAFAADPNLGDEHNGQHRYNAACDASRAVSGHDKGFGALDDEEKTRWRRQALDWLRADLRAYEKQLQSGQPADEAFFQGWLRSHPGSSSTHADVIKEANKAFVWSRLNHWKRDSDLDGLRDQQAFTKLAPEERQACQKLWSDVEKLLARAQARAMP